MSDMSSRQPDLSGDPNCQICNGVGYLRYDYPVGHPNFGKLTVCTCRQRQLERFAYQKLFVHSQLDELNHLTFDNFQPRGKKNYSMLLANTVETSYEAAHHFATNLEGWLLLQGGYGCGKTHLAAAIANFVVDMGIPTLFVTAPDLLDLLRFSFNDPETTFEQRFKDFREVQLLVLDDFGTHNATAWAQEKFFQILNHRYINKLPLVVTTNLELDEIDARIRSRLQDEKFVKHVHLLVPDYRLNESGTSNPALSTLDILHNFTFGNFDMRREEVGQESRVKITKERQDAIGKRNKETIVEITKITTEDIKTLERAFSASVDFAEDPQGWLTLLGPSGCGKTHLAAAIGNYRISSGSPAILVDLPDLLDYLRATFSSNVVSYQQRINEVKTTPLLILDSLGKGQQSPWGEEKLYQILNHRYYKKLPTVIVSHLTLSELEFEYTVLIPRLLDTNLCEIFAIEMPMYRQKPTRGKKTLKNR
jgi:DNA replication protein DnaC